MISPPDSQYSVAAFLKQTQPTSVFVPHLPGNNGDELMVLGLDELLEKHGIRKVPSPAKADWVFIRGNGAMNDFWRNALDTFEYHLRAHPDLPIAVMPSSYHFERTDFAGLLQTRTAPCVLFARERISYDMLRGMKRPDCVRIELDHDMALCLANGRMVQRYAEYRASSPKDYVLVVERSDLEHHGNRAPLQIESRYQPDGVFAATAKALVREPRRIVVRNKWRRRGLHGKEVISAGFESETRDFLDKFHPDFAKLPWKCADVSDPLKYSFDEFCSMIAGAAMVVTTRLHAGLLATMLHVPTTIRTGRYGKILGVYDYSLKDSPYAKLMPIKVPEGTHGSK
jgi:exopolysaccharide biosynthesis predicted pyruvyltransferase EpsI